MARASKIRASKQRYISINQLTLEGFETPFSQNLDSENRWVKLSHLIPWDEIVSVYDKQMKNSETGAGHINGRVILGCLMIKHLCNLSDEETILLIQENVYMQYFIGYSSFSNEKPFDSSLFVEIRKRLGIDQINAINEKIFELSQRPNRKENDPHPPDGSKTDNENKSVEKTSESDEQTHKGKLLIDATACPQDISYPTDLNLLNDAREKSEELIDILYIKEIHGQTKPRTYREKARKQYLKTAQKKNKTKKEIRLAIARQLRYLKRNINHIHTLLDSYESIPLERVEYKYLLVIQELYRQQEQMYRTRTHSIEHRIVSIHQPHVRPIVRGKEKAKVEFGAKIQVSLVDGFSFLDELNWEAFNEGALLKEAVEQYKKRTGYYPKEVLADKIYCNRENRKILKELRIQLVAKPLGRPSAVNKEYVRPGERNPIEGKFGQAKNAYGLNCIKARLNETSQSWIASIILVLNLVYLAGQAPLSLILRMIKLIFKKFEMKNHGLLFQ